MFERETRYLEEEDPRYRYLKEEDPRYLKELLEYPAESKGANYKSAVKFEKGTDFAAKLVKHILAFANSGGGCLIIGFKEQADRSLAPDSGITDEIVASYEAAKLCEHVEKYLGGQDRIGIKIYKEKFARIKYPIIKITGFQEYPFFCSEDYISPETGEAILKAGRVYIRTEGARTLVAATVKASPEWRQLISECRKRGKESRP